MLLYFPVPPKAQPARVNAPASTGQNTPNPTQGNASARISVRPDAADSSTRVAHHKPRKIDEVHRRDRAALDVQNDGVLATYLPGPCLLLSQDLFHVLPDRDVPCRARQYKGALDTLPSDGVTHFEPWGKRSV